MIFPVKWITVLRIFVLAKLHTEQESVNTIIFNICLTETHLKGLAKSLTKSGSGRFCACRFGLSVDILTGSLL